MSEQTNTIKSDKTHEFPPSIAIHTLLPFDVECRLFVESGENGTFMSKQAHARIRLTTINSTFWYGYAEVAVGLDVYFALVKQAFDSKTNRIMINFEKDDEPWTATTLHCRDEDGIITFAISAASPIVGVAPQFE